MGTGLKRLATGLSCIAVLLLVAALNAAQQAAPPARDTLPEGPLVFDSSTRGPGGSPLPGPKFRVVPTRGLSRPYALAFLPDGGILVTERAGRLRLVRNGVLDPQPIAGIPPVLDRNFKGLNDVVLHPQLRREPPGLLHLLQARSRLDRYGAGRCSRAAGTTAAHALSDVRDLFTTSTVVNGASGARFLFGRDGKIYLAVGIPIPATSPARGPRHGD